MSNSNPGFPFDVPDTLGIGDRIQEVGRIFGRNRYGEIWGSMEGRRRGRLFQVQELSRHDLSPVVRNFFGDYKFFKLPEARCKLLDETKFIPKRTFEIGDVIQKSFATFKRYGRIIGFRHPDGLESTSYFNGYNGTDLLECVKVSPRNGLERILDRNGKPKRFTTRPSSCKLCEVSPMGLSGVRLIGA